MLTAAERMKTLGQQPSDSVAPTSIFGSAAGLAHTIQSSEGFRIGVYPILCADMPEAAMGLASCLCYLLEQYPDTRVYRCFAKIDIADENAEITASDYQFSPADWTLDGLADNVILDGALIAGADGYDLQLAIDKSLSASDVDSDALTYHFESLAAVTLALPAIAAEVYWKIAGEVNSKAILEYDALDAGVAELEQVLEAVFGWNLDVYLYLWDVEWDESDVRDQYLEVADLCNANPGQFAYWTLGMMAKQVMQPGIAEIGELIVTELGRALSHDSLAGPGAAAAALGLSRLGQAQQALSFLQPRLRAGEPASVWCVMIEIQLNAGEVEAAIETAQLALESGLGDPALFWQYAELLMSAEVNNLNVDDVLLFDPDEYDEDAHMAVEIANALKIYTDGVRDDLGALQLALTYMIDVADDERWIYFERLLQRDEEGSFAGEVLDRFIELEDHDRAYDILESQLDSNAYAYVFLAQLALADLDSSLASQMVEACRAGFAEIDDNLELELQRITLQASLPSFAEQYAETKVMLSANRPVSEDKVESLERAIELAPKLVDLHLLLSACYRSWRDDESALEVLREAAEQAGPDPQIDLGIARILWAQNKRDDTISTLNAALERFPNDVYLLMQMASCLIENDQYEDARQYIALAETIAPSHRAIGQVRQLIAQKMA
ncbi:MAG: tetratricopeptide repeat protein [Chloroflexi bacterium]|nr:tetratricopeptide repeat protein [Chloroflexota bacterium]